MPVIPGLKRLRQDYKQDLISKTKRAMTAIKA
jgi:hypothetical protein